MTSARARSLISALAIGPLTYVGASLVIGFLILGAVSLALGLRGASSTELNAVLRSETLGRFLASGGFAAAVLAGYAVTARQAAFRWPSVCVAAVAIGAVATTEVTILQPSLVMAIAAFGCSLLGSFLASPVSALPSH